MKIIQMISSMGTVKLQQINIMECYTTCKNDYMETKTM